MQSSITHLCNPMLLKFAELCQKAKESCLGAEQAGVLKANKICSQHKLLCSCAFQIFLKH